MGYFEAFCLACGGPCVTPNLDELEEALEEKSKAERTQLKSMIKRLGSMDLAWVKEWILVTPNGTFQATPDEDYPGIMNPTNKLIDAEANDINTSNDSKRKLDSCFHESCPCFAESQVYGFHAACWELIQRPTFTDLELLNLKRDPTDNVVTGSDIYPLSSLMNQSFDFCDLNQSQLIHLEHPLRNVAASKLVLETWAKVQASTSSSTSINDETK